jgi:hypothetical protein
MSREGKLLGFLLGCAFLCMFFLPRIGTLEIDATSRAMTFREGVTFWRRRKVKRLGLPPGSRVVIGSWMDKEGFVTYSVKRWCADGKCEALLEQRNPFDAPAVSLIAAALHRFDGVEVRTVRLNAEFQQVDWEPRATAGAGRSSLLLFLLPWTGYVAGMFANTWAMVAIIGGLCLAVYLALNYLLVRQARIEDPAARLSSRVLFGFGTLQFMLMYTVFAFLGRIGK